MFVDFWILTMNHILNMSNISTINLTFPEIIYTYKICNFLDIQILKMQIVSKR